MNGMLKDDLNFCNTAIFYDYTNVNITVELNQARKCITNSFYKTITHTRILVSLSLFDDLILKINENDIENIHDLRENIFCMLSFEKLIKDEQMIVKPILNDNDEKSFLNFIIYKWN